MLFEVIHDRSVVRYVLPQQDVRFDTPKPVIYLSPIAWVRCNFVRENPPNRDNALRLIADLSDRIEYSRHHEFTGSLVCIPLRPLPLYFNEYCPVGIPMAQHVIGCDTVPAAPIAVNSSEFFWVLYTCDRQVDQVVKHDEIEYLFGSSSPFNGLVLPALAPLQMLPRHALRTPTWSTDDP